MERFPITQRGYKKLLEELRTLKSVDRPAVIQAIAEARELGDLSENAEYHAAREKQSFIEGRILDLEGKSSRSEVIDISKFSGPTVKFGATVQLLDEDGGIDLALILSINRSGGEEGLSGDDFVLEEEWLELKTRLETNSRGFQFIDHLKQEKPNRYHPLHFRIPLANIWRDCTSEEERYEAYHSWLRKGVELIIDGGEMERLRQRFS